MASINSLSTELITIICEQAQESIPNLRITCRDLETKSREQFLKTYFRNVSCYLHPAAIHILLEISNNPLFANEVRNLAFNGCGSGMGTVIQEHAQLVRDGCLRDVLAQILNNLPNCTALGVGWENGLGSSSLSGKYHFKSWTQLDAADELTTIPERKLDGFDLKDYFMVDLLDVITTTKHSLRKVHMPINIDYGLFADYVDATHHLKKGIHVSVSSACSCGTVQLPPISTSRTQKRPLPLNRKRRD